MSEPHDEQTPQWLIEALGTTHTTQSFRERMKAAGNTAYAMARMRVEKEKVGFVPLPLMEYLKGLASLAGVALEPVLTAAGIDGPASPVPKTAGLFGKLAHSLGMHLEELTIHLRIAVAEEAAGAPLPMLAAQRGGKLASHPKDCARVLDQIESRWPPELRTELAAIREAAVSGYRERAAQDLEVIQ